MSDITMCADQNCPHYATCYRAQATPGERQPFFALSPREGDKCHLYAPMFYTDCTSALKEQP